MYYRVLKNLDHDQKRYQIGDVLSDGLLNSADAAILLRDGVVEEYDPNGTAENPKIHEATSGEDKAPAPETGTPPAPETVQDDPALPLEELNHDQLVARAAAKDVDPAAYDNDEDLRAALKAVDEASAGGGDGDLVG